MPDPIFCTLNDFNAVVAAAACDLSTSVTVLVGRAHPPVPVLLIDLAKRANHPSNPYTPMHLSVRWWVTALGDLCADVEFTPATMT